MQNHASQLDNGKKGMAVIVSVLAAVGLLLIPLVEPNLASGDASC